ncbi:unannotated protein [freshwater metagenome]|uniref:Unannotated protein n=1 Tax=freshwater metagenome TaxID=449393 RepID=A0A6J7I0S7_9ZZZZ|nr:mycofactocin system glycosyltransferase [Actinomycetota bacterium]
MLPADPSDRDPADPGAAGPGPVGPPPPARPGPAGPALPVVLAPGVRRLEGGRVLAGGMPRRVLRLKDAGAAAVDALLAGRPGGAGALRLADRLVEAGVLAPVPAPGAARPAATVVVPVRDRADELDRCLAALGDRDPVLVVDDGSEDRAAVAEVARRHGARLLRRDVTGGPAAARNDGLGAVATPLVAFLDSDCLAPVGWLDALGGHFADPSVVAVAPRVAPLDRGGRSTLARFTAVRSPLDLGSRAAPVRPGGAVPYVPTAALVVRRDALGTAFDAALRFGEDVDLVWRLHDAGGRIRYDPRTVVRHAEPGSWGALLHRRFRYGTSAAPLAARHPGRLTPLVLRPAPAAAVGLALAGRPRAAAGAAVVHLALTARKLRGAGAPVVLALPWGGDALLRTAESTGRAAVGLAGPALLAGLARRRTRPAAAALVVVASAGGWWRARHRIDPVRWTLAATADEAAYGLGVWAGAWRHRTLAPLRPSTRSPGDGAARG